MVVDKFIPPYPLKTAVLFLMFKRLNALSKKGFRDKINTNE